MKIMQKRKLRVPKEALHILGTPLELTTDDGKKWLYHQTAQYDTGFEPGQEVVVRGLIKEKFEAFTTYITPKDSKGSLKAFLLKPAANNNDQ